MFAHSGRQHRIVSSARQPRLAVSWKEQPQAFKAHEPWAGHHERAGNAKELEPLPAGGPKSDLTLTRLPHRSALLSFARVKLAPYRKHLQPRTCGQFANDRPLHPPTIGGGPASSMDEADQETAAIMASMATMHEGDVSETVKHSCRTSVLEMFPDIDSAHMNLICEKLRWVSFDVVQRILDDMDGGKPYPKLQRASLKRKRDDDDNNTSAINPESAAKKWDTEGRRAQPRDPKASYTKMSHSILQQFFPQLYVDNLKSVMALNGGILYPTYLLLSKATAAGDDESPHMKKKKGRPPKGPPSLAGILDERIQSTRDEGEREALEELRAVRAVVALQEAEALEKRRMEEEEEHNLESARTEGTIADCGCCFVEHAVNRMVHCDGKELHFFCRDCARMMAETQIGMAKSRLDCMSTDGCTGGFSHSQRLIFLDPKSRTALEQIEMDTSIRASGIENIETCPFCPFAAEYPDLEIDREFRCLHDDCRIVSCRACRKETHIPMTCAEAALERGHSARHGIEEAMSEALIRKCNKCATPFIKENGCNKMTCTKCGNIQCYVCSKSCDYSHFNDTRRGGKTGNCELFDKEGGVEARHEQEVRAAEEEARKKAQEQHKDLDPELLRFKESEKVKEDEKWRKQGRHGGLHGQAGHYPDDDRFVDGHHARARRFQALAGARNRQPGGAQMAPIIHDYMPPHAAGPARPLPAPGQALVEVPRAAVEDQRLAIHAVLDQQRQLMRAERDDNFRALAAAANQQRQELAIDPAQIWAGGAPLPQRQPPAAAPAAAPAAPAPAPAPQPQHFREFRAYAPLPFDFNYHYGHANPGGMQLDNLFGGQQLQDRANQNHHRAPGVAPEARPVSLVRGPLENPVLPLPQQPGRFPLAAPCRGVRAQPVQLDQQRAYHDAPKPAPRPVERAGGGRDDPIILKSPVRAALIDLTREEDDVDGVQKLQNMDDDYLDWADVAEEQYLRGGVRDMDIWDDDDWDDWDYGYGFLN